MLHNPLQHSGAPALGKKRLIAQEARKWLAEDQVHRKADEERARWLNRPRVNTALIARVVSDEEIASHFDEIVPSERTRQISPRGQPSYVHS
jgi:hypothetical protein